MTQTGSPKKAVPAPGLWELAGFFLKLGTIAFGGPAAHIAMMEDELVRRRRWILAQDFLDMLAVSNLIPGPSSTELAIFIGYRLRGVAGLMLAGICFIGPAFVIVAALAWAYVRYGSLPACTGLLYGVKPVVIAIVIQALWRLGKQAIKSSALAVLGILALGFSFAGVSPVMVLGGAAVLAAAAFVLREGRKSKPPPVSQLPALPLMAGVGTVGLGGIFVAFFKIGCIVFGSGYVLLAFLRADLVVNRHWLSEGQLLDAVAIGQVTPGPVFTTATFIGYLLGGFKGATTATVGIFAPAFLLVALTGPLVRRLRASKMAGAVLDALNVASLALMGFVTVQLAAAALPDWSSLAIGLASAVLILRFKVNATWLVFGGAMAGLVISLVGKY